MRRRRSTRPCPITPWRYTMMGDSKKVQMDGLEARLLMHGGPGGGHFAAAGHGLSVGLAGGFGGCGGGVVPGIFLPATPNATVPADVTRLKTDASTLPTDV